MAEPAGASAPIVVVDTIRPAEGRAGELAREVTAVFPIERDATLLHGATEFELFAAVEPGAGYLMIQRWTSMAAFEDFHAVHRPPELSAFVERVRPLLDRPLEEVASFWRNCG